MLHAAFPAVDFLGEEGIASDQVGEYRWVVDPIDGTVNYAYGIPHACVSIALQRRVAGTGSAGFRSRLNSQSRAGSSKKSSIYPDGYQTLVGVVFDPFREELWTACFGESARLNGKSIRVSTRRTLGESIITMGLSKSPEHLQATLPVLSGLAQRVRKIRILGAAAIDLCYVATGRFDGFMERGIRLWDIAAGGLILECAGGSFFREPIPGAHAYRIVASNGLLQNKLTAIARSHANAVHQSNDTSAMKRRPKTQKRASAR
jgi:myo-inositol-1(or 4)-monophosphatase